MCNKGRANLGDAMRKREFEIGNEKLLDVGSADVLGLLDLNHAENLNPGDIKD